MNIKAIETVYNGYRFRSRLEARWAVFFDTLGIKYEYEKEGYELQKNPLPWIHRESTVWYLPDFWLPEQQYYIEIKGQEPSEEERDKAYRLSLETGTYVSIFYGSMTIPVPAYLYGPNIAHWGQGDFYWCQCPWCFKFDIAWRGNLLHAQCECIRETHRNVSGATVPESADERSFQAIRDDDEEAFERIHGHSMLRMADMGLWWEQKCQRLCLAADTPELIAAYVTARQARFEHGERG